MTGEANTFDGDGTIVVAGKLEAQESNLKIIYTEDGTGYEMLRGYFGSTNSTCYLRVAPNGATTGNYRHTSAKGVITKFPQFAELDASQRRCAGDRDDRQASRLDKGRGSIGVRWWRSLGRLRASP
jgi:hypothetical protein